MKATFEIPDELYRQVKARSAMEGRPLRSVAIELFQNWLQGNHQPAGTASKRATAQDAPTRFDNAPWRGIIRPYIRPGMSHDLDEMKEAISRGWGDEAAAKIKPSGD
jgi:hypothetical protein